MGDRELAWLERFGKPRLPREPFHRSFYGFREVDPDVQKQSLRDYLKISPMMVPAQDELRKPTIRHPDLSPNNIFVSSSGEITSLIDWQHTSVLPLFLQAKVPKHFQNWGDDDSENFRPPRLPENFDNLTPTEQDAEQEVYRRRQVHYFYVGYTNRLNEKHFNAIGKPHLVMTDKLFETAGRPWEGDNVSLKAEIINVLKQWPTISSVQSISPQLPIQYTEEEITQCIALDEQQQEADAQMQILRDCFTTDIDGRVPMDLYDQAKAREDDVREQMLNAADTEADRKEIEENWPFQDHDEID